MKDIKQKKIDGRISPGKYEGSNILSCRNCPFNQGFNFCNHPQNKEGWPLRKSKCIAYYNNLNWRGCPFLKDNPGEYLKRTLVKPFIKIGRRVV